ncbi:MAG TPA: STAS domain-containing protein [Polyangiales bacterium]|nr:STAS domain-containing protein [Polyangiales bacterium]
MESQYTRIPIIKVWNLLLIPLQGEMTDELANELTNEVLDRIHQLGCSGLVIDITGLWIVDSHLCAVLSQLSSAAALMGARTYISGMKPDIALALETMGVQLKGVNTTLDLEDALELLGIRGPDTLAEDEDVDSEPPEEEPADDAQVAPKPGRTRELITRTHRSP